MPRATDAGRRRPSRRARTVAVAGPCTVTRQDGTTATVRPYTAREARAVVEGRPP